MLCPFWVVGTPKRTEPVGPVDRKQPVVGDEAYGRFMDSTWETRDLPVLRAIVELSEEGVGNVPVESVASRTGLDEETVRAAFLALEGEQPPFCRFSETQRLGGRRMDFARSPTGHARRTVGAWPTPENLADRIIAALVAEADREADPVRKSRLQHAADVGKGVLTGVLTTVITQQV